MKKYLFLTVLALLPTMALRAQDTNTHVYQSVFGDSLTEWYVLITYDDMFAHGAASMYMAPDSIVSLGDSGHYYTQLVLGMGTFTNDWPLLRESDDHSKLFYNDYFALQDDSYPDILLMDLSLEVGDTLNTSSWPPHYDPEGLYSYWSSSAPPTIRIDSVYYINGHKILQTNYSHPTEFQNDTLLFIEGVGPSMGLLYPIYRDYTNFLLCYYRDDESLILDKHFGGDCGIFWTSDYWPIGVIQFNDDSFIRLYPNPVHDVLNIEMAVGEPATLTLVSTDGWPMLQREVQDEHVKVDVSALPTGVYTLTIQNKQHSITKKIVKL